MSGVAITSTSAQTALTAQMGVQFPSPGARSVRVLQAFSLKPVSVFADAALSVPVQQPILTDSAGNVPGFVASASVALQDQASGMVFQAATAQSASAVSATALPSAGGLLAGSVNGTTNEVTWESGASLMLPGVPTADPHVVGQVWSNAGVLTISAG